MEEQEKEELYIEYLMIQQVLIGLLRDMGITYGGLDRLPLFWLRTRLPKLIGESHQDKLGKTIFLIDTLVEYRKHGYEPPHKYERYV